MKVGPHKLINGVGARRVGECENYRDYQGGISRCHGFLCQEVIKGLGLETQSYFSRGARESVLPKVTPRVKVEPGALARPREPCPVLWVHRAGLGRPNSHPKKDLAHSEGLG